MPSRLLCVNTACCAEYNWTADISFTVREGSYWIDNLEVTYRGHANGTICSYENSASNRFSSSIGLSNSGSAIQEDDVELFYLEDPTGAEVVPNSTGFYDYLYYDYICDSGPCSQSGPVADSGLWGRMDSLPTGNYTGGIEMVNGQVIDLNINFPGQLVLPFVSSTTMDAAYAGSDLVLSWTSQKNTPFYHI